MYYIIILLIAMFVNMHYNYEIMLNIYTVSLFPEMIQPVLETSMLYKAQDKGIVQYHYINLRDFGNGPRRQVDDTPYGGGDGMLMRVDCMVAAIEYAKSLSPNAKVILPTPSGVMYKQSYAKAHAAEAADLILVCPRYEGYDQRVDKWVDQKYCIGNYVLTGGELPALVIIDSIVRLLPGVLGGQDSAAIESFADDDVSIEYAQYTRPEEYKGLKVPEVLLSGNHASIAKWRASKSYLSE